MRPAAGIGQRHRGVGRTRQLKQLIKERFYTSTAAQRRKLEAAFGVTDRAVRKALYFDSDSDLSRRIRKAARENGCVLAAALPVAETIHATADGTMLQELDNGAQLPRVAQGAVRGAPPGRDAVADPGDTEGGGGVEMTRRAARWKSIITRSA